MQSYLIAGEVEGLSRRGGFSDVQITSGCKSKIASRVGMADVTTRFITCIDARSMQLGLASSI